MTDLFEEYMSRQRHSPLIGPSSLHTCVRQMAYQYLDCEPTDEVDQSAADFGTLVHLGWSAMIRAMFDPAERAPNVEVHWGGPRPGSADDVDYRNCVVTDLKVPGGRSFQWQIDHGMKQEHTDQLQVYAHGLTLKHGGDWRCRLYLINRDDPSQRHVHEFPYEEATALALVVDANQRHESLTAAAMVGSMTASADDRYALAETFPREGNGRGSFPCDWCRFEARCLPQPENPDRNALSEEIAGNTEEVLSHASEYFAANAKANEYKKQADRHRAYLAGLDGTYTGNGMTVRVSTVGGNARPDVPDAQACADIIDRLGLDVPMVAQPPSTRYTRVERKAQ